MALPSFQHISLEQEDHVLLIGLNRPSKMNAFNRKMLNELASAYTLLEEDPELRVACLFPKGDHFTAGLDLGDVAPNIQEGGLLFEEGVVDPLQLFGETRSKPVVMAVQGYCLTIGLELILSNDICVAGPTTKFGQIEIKRGIFPFGGATIRMAQRCGWGNAMRYLLTGDYFNAQEALRISLIQEIADDPIEQAIAIAKTIAQQAPLGVQASLLNARKAMNEGFNEAAADLMPTILRLMQTEDAQEGLQSFLERRTASFKGK
jgi:enoyl-CoA hydratase